MKKLVGFIVVIVLAFVILVGCGNEKTDVVVIGAGGGGLAAAIEAHDAGAKVVVLEKMPMVGGNTTRATGGLNAAGTLFQQAMGIEDTPEVFYADTMKGGYEKNDPELVKVLTTEAAKAVDWLTGLGADLSDVGRLGGHSVNRSHRPTGGAPVGAHIVQVLKKAAEERKIDIRLWNEAVEIETDKNGKITSVKAINKEGKEYTISAKTVIVATGGFGGSPEKVVQYQPELAGFGTTNHAGATGDGLDLVAKLDVQLVDMAEIQTHPTVVPEKGVMITEAVRGNGAILINRDGERFVNELHTRDVVSEAILAQEGKTAYLFFDESVRKSLSAIEKYIDMGLITEASSLVELAEKLGMDAAVLQATVEEYNQAVAAIADAKYGRPDLPRALSQANYYVVEVGPAVHHTMGGIKINRNAEVINQSGQVIPGLYAAGEATGDVHGGNRLGGNALADIIVFGRIAGANAAASVK